jgi:DNA-binding GntR family transcriptional regulator
MTTGSVEREDSAIRFTTKAEAVYEEIRRRILRGVLPPASPLNQDALALELGVSVTPVREAVRRLEADGLLQVHAHRSVLVSPLSLSELSEIYDVRLQLDPYAAAVATTKARAEALARIEQMAQTLVSRDPLEQATINRAFHRAIYVESRNGLLIGILDGLWERTDRYRIMLVSTEIDVKAVVNEHLEIVAAMRARRPREVAKLIRAHVMKARASIERALD